MSAAEETEGRAVFSGRWAEAKALATRQRAIRRDAMRRDKKDRSNQAATYLRVYRRNELIAQPLSPAPREPKRKYCLETLHYQSNSCSSVSTF